MKKIRILIIFITGLTIYTLLIANLTSYATKNTEPENKPFLSKNICFFIVDVSNSLESLKTLFIDPYRSYIENTETNDGFVFFEEELTIDRLFMLTSYELGRHKSEIVLYDVNNNKTIKKWNPPMKSISDLTYNKVNERFKKGTNLFLRHPLLLKDSSIIGGTCFSLVRINSNSEIDWVNNSYEAHHSVEQGPDGFIWICGRRNKTKLKNIIKDEDVDLILISTRHDSHGSMVLKALEAGKNVFVEKPLAVNQDELDAIKDFYNSDAKDKPLLMVGFNRRFSKYAKEIKKHTSKRINPLLIHYRMNAGYIPLDHWVHEDGGRMVGEACHIIDLMSFFTGSEIESISVESLNPKTSHFSESDNKATILKYKDGSVCTVEYFAIGNKKFPKEYMEVHFDEKTITMDDYKQLKGYGVNLRELKSPTSQKGQKEELVALHNALKIENSTWPIELWDIIQTTEISFVI